MPVRKVSETEFHPAANLFPRMSAADYQELKSDIEKNGLQTPLTFWKGQLVDGRHRLQACEELGLQIDIWCEELDADKDPVEFALSLNLKRRHLSPSQLAMVVDKVRDMYDAEAEERKRQGGKTAGNGRKKDVENLPTPKQTQRSRDKAAATVGVSGKLADAARDVRKNGTPELAEAVESGEVSVTAAATVARHTPKSQQKDLVKSKQVKQAASEIRKRRQSASKVGKKIESAVSEFLSAEPEVKDAELLLSSIETVMQQIERFMSA